MWIGSIVVSTLRQIVVVAVIGLLFLEFDVLGTIGNKLDVAWRCGNTSGIGICPDRPNESWVSRSGSIGGIGSARRIILSTQEITTVIDGTERGSHTSTVIHSSGGIWGVPSHSKNFSHTHKLRCFIICHGLFAGKTRERSSKIRTTGLLWQRRNHIIYVVKKKKPTVSLWLFPFKYGVIGERRVPLPYSILWMATYTSCKLVQASFKSAPISFSLILLIYANRIRLLASCGCNFLNAQKFSFLLSFEL